MPEQGEAISFIRIKRSLFKHWLWKESRTFTKCEAWLDLIRRARFEQSEAVELINGKLIKWSRGQLPASIRFLGGKWNWGDHKVRDFLDLLEKDKMITIDKTQGLNVITLLSFDQHNPIQEPNAQRRAQQNPPPQSILPDTGHSEGHTGGTQGAQGGHNNKEEEQEECKEENTLFGPDVPKEEKVNGHKRKKKKAVVYSDEQKESFSQAVEWIMENTPRVLKMPEPLTIAQYLSLMERFPENLITDCLIRMHNWRPLKDRQSAYFTFLTFAEKRQNEN